MTDSTSPADEAVDEIPSDEVLDRALRLGAIVVEGLKCPQTARTMLHAADRLAARTPLPPQPAPPAPPADVREAVFTELRSRKLLKYLFAPIPADERDYGYLDAPFDITIQHEIVDALIAATFVSTEARENAVDGLREAGEAYYDDGSNDLDTRTDAFKAGANWAFAQMTATLSRKDASSQPERRPAADLETAAHEFKAHWHYGSDPADVYDHALRATFAALGITFEEPDPA